MLVKHKYKEIVVTIKAARQIILFHHTNPDLDTYSSAFAFFHWLSDNFPQKEVLICLDTKHLDCHYFKKYLEKYKPALVTEDTCIKKQSIAIVFDVCQTERIFANNFFQQTGTKIVFDHHLASNDMFDIKIINSAAVATTQLLTEFFQHFEQEFSFTAITAHFLYYGLVTDTGRFQFLNNKSTALMIGAQLINRGAQPQKVYVDLYCQSEQQKRFMGYILLNFVICQKLAYLVVTRDVLERFSLMRSEASRFVNMLAMMKGITIHALITEDNQNGNWVVSLRSRELSVNVFAEQYGGGGHRLAAGLKIPKHDDLKMLLTKLSNFSATHAK